MICPLVEVLATAIRWVRPQPGAVDPSSVTGIHRIMRIPSVLSGAGHPLMGIRRARCGTQSLPGERLPDLRAGPERRIVRPTWVRNSSLIHISEPTRLGMISYAVFCLKKK